MIGGSVNAETSPAVDKPVATFWVPLGMAGLLLGEAFALHQRYSLPDLAGWPAWGRVLASASTVAFPTGVALLTALLLFGGRSLRDHWQQVSDPAPIRAYGTLCLLLHAATFGAFVWLSGKVLSPFLAHSSLPSLWLVMWMVTGAAVLVSGFGVVLPWNRWRRVVNQGGGLLAVSFFVALSAWKVGQWVDQGAWDHTPRWTLLAVARFLEMLGQEPHVDVASQTLGIRNFVVTVGAGCSGYEGMGLMVVFLTAYLILFRREFRFPVALTLIPLGVVVAWFANLVRIAALLLIGGHGAPALALGAFHTRTGWVLFCAVALAFVGSAPRLPWVRKEKGSGVGMVGQATTVFLLPWLSGVAVDLLLPMLGVPAPWVAVMRVLVAGGVCFACLPGLRVAIAASRRADQSCHCRGHWVACMTTGIAGGLLFVLLTTTKSPAAAPALSFTAAVQFLGYVCLTPVLEELAFRGFLARRLVSTEFWKVPGSHLSWSAVLLSSLLFGVLHESWLGATLVGVLCALLYRHCGRLREPIVAHGLANAVVWGLQWTPWGGGMV